MIFNIREIRATLNVGFNKLNPGKIDNKSMIAIGVKGYIT